MRRRCLRLVSGSIACFLLSGLPLIAQEPIEPPNQPFEIGISGGGQTSVISNGGDLRLTVTVPGSGRRAFEGFVGGYSGSNSFDIGIYGFQVKRPISWHRRRGVEPFATVGLMGWFDRYESWDCPNRSCRPHKATLVMPPVLGLVGVGVRYTITPRLAVRLESQAAVALFIPVGVRVAAGVSMPIGGATYRRTGR